jgi:hypothetical protein
MTCILAIDPGVTGALAFYYPKTGHVGVHDMPVVNGDVDPRSLDVIIWNYKPQHAFLEHVHPMPKEGVSSVWRFAAAFTTVRVVVKLRNIPLTLVSPARWKRAMGLKGGKEGKDHCRERAIEAFPVVHQQFVRKKDHGRAEAALLALYARDMLRGHYDDRISTSQPVEP